MREKAPDKSLLRALITHTQPNGWAKNIITNQQFKKNVVKKANSEVKWLSYGFSAINLVKLLGKMFMFRRNQNFLFVNLENLLLLAKNNFHQQNVNTTTTKLCNRNPLWSRQSHMEKRSFSKSRSRSFSSATSSMNSSGKNHFNIQDYDIIGFDLDCTLLR